MKNRHGLIALALGVSVVSTALVAGPDDYGLVPRAVAEGVWVVEGARESFSRENGGNIVNTGFVATDDGIVVIDTGPSRRYGEQLRAAAARVAPGKVARVFVTHAHPDHFLGDQAFGDVPILALPGTRAAIARAGEKLSANLYQLVGGWMLGTEVVTPAVDAVPGPVRIGGRDFRLLALSGHTSDDLAILDERTKTLFAGDLAFLDRTPTTPNADLPRWLDALDTLQRLDVRLIVPGHGPVVAAPRAIVQTRAYLRWLGDTLHSAAGRGMDMNEVMRLSPPPEFASLSVSREEFVRSVVHLYPRIEEESLRKASTGKP